MPILDHAPERVELMRRTRTVAVVGVSDRPARPSHGVAAYLLDQTGWEVFFVNPGLDEVLGAPCYPDLAALPVVPDMVDVFRRVDELPGVVDDAIGVGATSVWFQLGLRHEVAAERASAAGLDVVQDACLKVEHARFCGGLDTSSTFT